MFIGHFAVGMAAKKAAPKISLGTLFIAAQFLDLLWPTLLLLNIEQVAIKPGTAEAQPLDFIYYPVSHSLLMVLLWGIVTGFIYWLFKKNTKAAVILALCVVSHWVLDLIVHFPDLPLFPGKSPFWGLGLWGYKGIALVIEGSIFIAGVVLYLQATKAKNKSGLIGFWLLVVLLAGIHIANIFGPPPPGVNAIAWAGQLQWLFVLLAYWTDRNRISKAGS